MLVNNPREIPDRRNYDAPPGVRGSGWGMACSPYAYSRSTPLCRSTPEWFRYRKRRLFRQQCRQLVSSTGAQHGSKRIVLFDYVLKYLARQWMREVNANSRWAAPSHPTLNVCKIRYGYLNECPNCNAQISFETAAENSAIGYLYCARTEFFSGDRCLPVHQDTNGSPLLLACPFRGGGFEGSVCHYGLPRAGRPRCFTKMHIKGL